MGTKCCACHEICTSGCQKAAPATRFAPPKQSARPCHWGTLRDCGEPVASPWRARTLSRGTLRDSVGFYILILLYGRVRICLINFSYYGSFLTKFLRLLAPLPSPYTNHFFKLRLTLMMVMSGSNDGLVAVAGLLCSSWISMSRGSTMRTPLVPMGLPSSRPSVKYSNKLTMRRNMFLNCCSGNRNRAIEGERKREGERDKERERERERKPTTRGNNKCKGKNFETGVLNHCFLSQKTLHVGHLENGPRS